MRITGYQMECNVSLEMEVLLEQGKLDGTVTEGDCDSGIIWFEGRPGPAMRKFRADMLALSEGKPAPSGSPEAARLVRKYSRVRAARRALGR